MAGEEEPPTKSKQLPVVGEEGLEQLGLILDSIVSNIRGIHWSLRSIFAPESPWVTSFKKLKEGVQPEAVVFKQGLQPLTLKIIASLGRFFDNYLDQDLVVFRKRIMAAGLGAAESAKLCDCLAGWYESFAADLRKRVPLAEQILVDLNFEARAHEKQMKLLQIKSNIKDHVFAPLILVHSVGCFATPFALKYTDSGLSQQVAAKTENEAAVAAAWVLMDTAIPATDRVAKSLREAGQFFKSLGPWLLRLGNQTFPVGVDPDAAWMEASAHQYELMREKAFRLQMKCNDLLSLTSLLEFDLEIIPNLEEGLLVDEYTQTWLEEQEAPAEMELRVTIVGAKGLPSTDPLEEATNPGVGGSDPYCTCQILGKKRSLVKTPVLRDTLSPSWKFEAQVPDYAVGDDLFFTVWDKDFGKADDLLGKVTLPEESFLESGSFDGQLKLDTSESPGELPPGSEALLHVKVRLFKSEGTAGVTLANKVRDATEDTEIISALDP